MNDRDNRDLIITSNHFAQVMLVISLKSPSMLAKMQSCFSAVLRMIPVNIFEVIGYGKMKTRISSLLCQVQSALEIAQKTPR